MKAHFILFVADQEKSTAFYRSVLECSPRLHVPGMTEFALDDGAVLGLMPSAGIVRLLGHRLAKAEHGSDTPRAELYLLVDEPSSYFDRALRGGAQALSPLEARAWGHEVAYCFDPDGHVLAFAREMPPET